MGSAAEQISCRYHRRRRTSLAEATTEEWRRAVWYAFPFKHHETHSKARSKTYIHWIRSAAPSSIRSSSRSRWFSPLQELHSESCQFLLRVAAESDFCPAQCIGRRAARLNALEEEQQPKQTPTLSGMQHGQVDPSKQNEPQSSTLQQSVAQVPKYMCETTLSDHTECYIFADPNYDLHTSNSSFSLWETFANLWKPTVPKIEKLP